MNGIKNAKRIMLILLVLFTIFSTYANNTYASSVGDIISGSEGFITNGQAGDKIKLDSLRESSGQIYNILLTIGIAITIIVGLILGIQFMTGSVEAKGKVKESLIPYIAGCVVIFGAFGIWKLVVTLLQNI